MKLIVALLSLFIIAQLLGIFTGIMILLDVSRNPYIDELVVTGNTNEPANALFFILYVLAGAVFMMLLIRFLGFQMIIFKLMEFLLISTSSSLVFYAVLRLFSGYEISMLAAIGLGLLFGGARAALPQLKNAAAVMATAGVGVIFGISMGVLPIILFLILLAVYDYISVFITRHMVLLADFVVKKDLAFTVTAREAPTKPGEKEKRIDLGTGDLIAPIMLEVSALSLSPVATVFVFFGAVVSLGLFLLLVWRKKVVLPALPPIVLGMIVAFLAGLLLGFY